MLRGLNEQRERDMPPQPRRRSALRLATSLFAQEHSRSLACTLSWSEANAGGCVVCRFQRVAALKEVGLLKAAEEGSM
jgi:hypothetical protein